MFGFYGKHTDIIYNIIKPFYTIKSFYSYNENFIDIKIPIFESLIAFNDFGRLFSDRVDALFKLIFEKLEDRNIELIISDESINKKLYNACCNFVKEFDKIDPSIIGHKGERGE